MGQKRQRTLFAVLELKMPGDGQDLDNEETCLLSLVHVNIPKKTSGRATYDEQNFIWSMALKSRKSKVERTQSGESYLKLKRLKIKEPERDQQPGHRTGKHVLLYGSPSWERMKEGRGRR